MNNNSTNPPKRPYFRPTTAQQRKLLFETYEQTRNAEEACRIAHLGLATFYYWKPRFDKDGYAGLEQTGSHARHSYARAISQAIVDEVIEMRKAHPTWGRRRITHSVSQNHGWHQVVSPSEVRRILIDAGLMTVKSEPAKKGGLPSNMPTALE